MVSVLQIETVALANYHFFGDFIYEPESMLLRHIGRTIRLTPQENAVLFLLATQGGKEVEYSRVYTAVCAVRGTAPRAEIVKVLISYLRRKMGELAGDHNVGHKYLSTVMVEKKTYYLLKTTATPLAPA